jgi:hypothetical protein
MNDKQLLLDALKSHYKTDDICTGKGGFHIRCVGFITIAQARKLTGIKPQNKRQTKNNITVNSDYNWLCRIAGKV